MENKVIPTQAELDVLAQNKLTNSMNIIKHVHVDITGDLISGALLGQILYWFQPNSQGKRKVRVIKENNYWLAKNRTDWWDEIRITPKQYDRAIKLLEKKGFIVRKKFKFNGSPTSHIRPDYQTINHATNEWLNTVKEEIISSSDPITGSNSLETVEFPQRSNSNFPKGQNGISPKVKMELPQRVNSLTETTAETTAETTDREQQQQEKPKKKKEVVVSSDQSILICEKWEELYDQTLSTKKISTLSNLAVEGMKVKQIDIHNPSEQDVVRRIMHVMEQMRIHSYPFNTNALKAISDALQNGYTWTEKKKSKPRKRVSAEKIPSALSKQLNQGYKQTAATVEKKETLEDDWQSKLAEWNKQKRSNTNRF